MREKIKNKKIGEKGISLFEILILIVSIVSFSYFVGNELGFVSAADASNGINSASSSLPIPPSATVPTTAGTAIPHGALIGEGPGVTGTATTTATTTTGGLSSVAPEGSSYLAGTQATGAQAAAAAEAATTKAASAKLAWATIGTAAVNIASNFVIATLLYFGTYSVLTGIFNANGGAAQSVSTALAIGWGGGSAIGIIAGIVFPNLNLGFPILGITASGLGLIAGGVGALIGVGWWIFAGVHDQKLEAITFTCAPWQPQSGGTSCDKCNKGDLPCTKSKCQSLGAACELLNEGKSNEACVWSNRNDISPPTISSWDGPLDKTKYEYVPDTATLPGDKGVIIKYKNSNDGCAPAFSRIFYGISLDKFAKCKWDINRTDNFAEMTNYLSNGYSLKNHTILSLHGGATELGYEGINLTNGGNYKVYIRCESTNGYSNTGTFVFKYCVQNAPDTTAPTITLTDPLNGWYTENGKTSQDVNVYTDKPADCKWSHSDEGYTSMPNTMTCSQSVTEMNANTFYKCSTTLDGLKDNTENDFYFNCKSYPSAPEGSRYTMATNYKYVLTGTQPLVIDSVTPVDGATIKDSTQSVKVTLTAKTSAGYNQGQAWCSLKPTSASDSSYVLFANTNSYQHSQDLWLNAGSYDYTIKCCDLAELTGNCATQETTFNVETDFEAPIVTRVYNDNNQLKIVTNEQANCVYGKNDCNYDFKDGIKLTTTNNLEHTTDWNTNSNFYIKCQDQFGNLPAPDECSIVVRPFTSY